jgi:hypothetical protein
MRRWHHDEAGAPAVARIPAHPKPRVVRGDAAGVEGGSPSGDRGDGQPWRHVEKYDERSGAVRPFHEPLLAVQDFRQVLDPVQQVVLVPGRGVDGRDRRRRLTWDEVRPRAAGLRE